MRHPLDANDVRTLLQLTLGLHDRRDRPADAADWLIRRLRDLTGAAAGVIGRSNGEGVLQPLASQPAAAARHADHAFITATAEISRGPAVVHPATRLHGRQVYSVLPIGEDVSSVLWLQQPKSPRHPWTRREVLLLDLLHPEIAWLHDEPTDGTGEKLSPRQAETLRLLLRGLSEKQIAASLKLSVHTVHVYVKAIYRAHRVSSRAELLAKWVKR